MESTQKMFNQYVIDKLALMHCLELPIKDVINLLVEGITQSSVRATALSVMTDSIESFLERMRHITEGLMEPERKITTVTELSKLQDSVCKNCGKRGHS